MKVNVVIDGIAHVVGSFDGDSNDPASRQAVADMVRDWADWWECQECQEEGR